MYQNVHTSSINDLIFISNTFSFLSCSEDFNIKFYDIESMSNYNTIDQGLERAWCLASKNNLFACGFDNGFQVYQIKGENTLITMHSNGRIIYKLKGDPKILQGNLKPILRNDKSKSGISIDDCVKHLANLDYEINEIRYSIDGK